MRVTLISLFLLLAISVNVVSASPKEEQQVPKSVVVQVEKDTGGRVLNASVTETGYQLKVLLPGGRVKLVTVEKKQ